MSDQSKERRAVSLDRYGDQRLIFGEAHVRRTKGQDLPKELVQDDDVVAVLGRYSWFNIFMGRGQRVDLSTGERWRVRAAGWSRYICPMVVDLDRGKLAIAKPGVGTTYGINGRSWGFVMAPTEGGRGRSNGWTISEDGTELAVVSRKPQKVFCGEALPLAAILLSFVLTRFDIPGERELGVPITWK
jgi:hypothetical protein